MDVIGEVKLRSRANTPSFKRAAVATALFASTISSGAALSALPQSGGVKRQFSRKAVSFPASDHEVVAWGDYVGTKKSNTATPSASLSPYVINYMPQHIFLKRLSLKIILQQPLTYQEHYAIKKFAEIHSNQKIGFKAGLTEGPVEAWNKFLKRRGIKGTSNISIAAIPIRMINQGRYRMVYPYDEAIRFVIAQTDLEKNLRKINAVEHAGADLAHPKLTKEILKVFDKKFLDYIGRMGLAPAHAIR